MKKLLFAVGLVLAMGQAAFADGMTQVVDPMTTEGPRRTTIVFNDSGSTLTSHSVVVWDNDDTEFDRSGLPYVTTATTNGSAWVAGVTVNDCNDQAPCEIITYGDAIVRIAHSTQAGVEDATVSTSTVAGQAGDWDGGAGECSLGPLKELRSVDTGATATISQDNTNMRVFVNISCED